MQLKVVGSCDVWSIMNVGKLVGERWGGLVKGEEF